MKLAVISPPQFLTALSSIHSSIGYNFALAQHILSSPEYGVYYRRLSKVEKSFLIVDNGASEGELQSFDELVKAAELVNASEVIMPDVLKDGEATKRLTLEACKTEKVPYSKRMVVPQGSTWDEWADCLLYLMQHTSFATIGIPKHLETLKGGRAYALDKIRYGKLDKVYNIHLLGIHTYPFREILRALEILPTIRGIDTAAPVAWAQQGKIICDEADGTHHSLDWDRMAIHYLVFLNAEIYSNVIKETTEGELEQASIS